jgi:histidinol-phosphate aminotransferase
VEGRDASRLKQDLAAHGVLVRHYTSALLQNYIRVSVGRPEDTDILIKLLMEVS